MLKILMSDHVFVSNHMKVIIDTIGDEKVDVYRNIIKKLFSVRRKGKVILHTDYINLIDVSYIVRIGGRQRVLNTGVKNVHAFISGKPAMEGPINNQSFEVNYNPRKAGFFYKKPSGLPVFKSKDVNCLIVKDFCSIIAT